jgi:hypothetical protein
VDYLDLVEPLPLTKLCTKCKEDKPLEAFLKDKACKYGRKGYCKECSNALNRQYYKDHYPSMKPVRKYYELKKRYGISKEEYENLLNLQNDRCAICDKHKSNSTHGTLYLDHCHNTNKTRALLCDKCNTGLGHFQDNSELLMKAIKYLEDHK